MATRAQYLSIPFAGMAAGLLLLAALIPAAVTAAAAVAASRWETYTNTRYGVMIDYPSDLFAIQPPPPDNAGRNFEAPALKARFYVYTHANALDQSLQELEEEDVTDLGDKDATKQNGADWYQVVGIKDDEEIVRRVVLSAGGSMVHRLEIAFPANAAGGFAPVMDRMTKSFRVDPTIPERAAGTASEAAPATAAPPKKAPESVTAAPPATPMPPMSSAPGPAPQTQASAAEPEKISGGGWRIKMPSKAYKDLPTLLSDRDVAGEATLGNILFVCDRNRYYALLVSPFFKYRLTQKGRLALNTGLEYATSFRDLHGTRDPLGKKIDWDADILYTEIPKMLLATFTDESTLRVDVEERSWTVELKGIAAKVQPFTTLCETGRPVRSK